jgi:hypothetical protein
MDIAGAKALKKRLGPYVTDQTPSASVDVPQDAPPVYKWVGVTRLPAPVVDDEPPADIGSSSRRLG